MVQLAFLHDIYKIYLRACKHTNRLLGHINVTEQSSVFLVKPVLIPAMGFQTLVVAVWMMMLRVKKRRISPFKHLVF